MEHAPQAGLIAASSRTAPPCPVFRPATIEAALAALQHGAVPPTLVAGGTDLCAQYNEGLQPAALVALDRIPALRIVTMDAGVLWIGSGVTHAEGCAHPLISAHLPGFAEAWRQIANVRVRFWATIGGNLMARRSRYEMPLLLTALGARIEFLDAAGAAVERTPAESWTGSPARGLLHRIGVPVTPGCRLFYDRSLRPVMTLALCGDTEGMRAVIATERLRPVLLPVPPGAPARAAAAAFEALPETFGDAAAGHWYLRRAGEALLRRALERDAAHG